ncbi:hypothetical protein ACIGEP_11305 [Microbacterium sp. NPDC077663]|uniref:hypothetical protein n=1 Tax=Microbacterium sp. NPDC077663 TaxID=3364189 RepID=UPI0037C6D1E6
MRRRLLALTALALSIALGGCVSTASVDDSAPTPSSSPTSSAKPAPTPTPTPTPEPEVSPDPTYGIPVEDPLEASRLVFESDAVGVDPVTVVSVSASAVRDQEYVLEFDCIPRDATITLSLSPAVGEDDPPVNFSGPIAVTQGCSAPGRTAGIRVDRMVGVQISMSGDDVSRAWAVLRPAE